MSTYVQPEELFEQAIKAIPYDLTPTSITQGDLEPDKDDFIEYAEEFTFSVQPRHRAVSVRTDTLRREHRGRIQARRAGPGALRTRLYVRGRTFSG